ncbi:hypothetical protein [Seonamhaeicola sp.]|uniref:hypothetical protein n=1 Tax=Seonamhaeicola sp. TaxID=1912245 RepID=UPI0035647036
MDYEYLYIKLKIELMNNLDLTTEQWEKAKKIIREQETEQLTLCDVSQQRELLLAYAEYHNENFEYEKIYDIMIDKYLSSQ